MKVYLIKEYDVAKQFRQLFRLSADCGALRWNRVFVNKPIKVCEAIEVIEEYIQNCIDQYCTQEALFGEISEEETEKLYPLFRKSPVLKSTLGSGVVLIDEKLSVTSALEEYSIPPILFDALRTAGNILLV